MEVLKAKQGSNLILISDVGTDGKRNDIFDTIYRELSDIGFNVQGVMKGVGLVDGNAKRKVAFPVTCLEGMLTSNNNFTKCEQALINEVKNNPIVLQAFELEELRTNRKLPEFLNTLAIYYVRMNEVLMTYKPKVCLMWHQFNSFHMILEGLCKNMGIYTYFLEHGLLPGSLNIELEGQMALSQICKFPEKFNKLPVTAFQSYSAKSYIESVLEQKTNRKPKGRSLSDYLKKKGVNIEHDKVVFYAGQNDPKTGIIPNNSLESKIHSPFYSSTFDALEDLAINCKILGLTLLYKPHPSIGRYELLNKFDYIQNPHVVFIPSNIDFLECVESSSLFVTILSTGAYQAVFRSIPTLLLGHMPLSVSDSVYQLGSKANLNQVLQKALNSGFTSDQRDALHEHIARLMHHYVWQENDSTSNVFPRSIRDFATCLSSMTFETTETKGNNQRVLDVSFGERSQLIPVKSDYASEFLKKFTAKITDIKAQTNLDKNWLTEQFGFPSDIIQIEETTELNKTPVFIIRSSKHRYYLNEYGKVSYNYIVINLDEQTMEEAEVDIRKRRALGECFVVVLPTDMVDFLDEAIHFSSKVDGLLIGIVFGFISPDSMHYNERLGTELKFIDVVHHFDSLFVPGLNPLTQSMGVNLAYFGCWTDFDYRSLKELKMLDHPTKRKKGEVVVVTDFSHYQLGSALQRDFQKQWLHKVVTALKSSGLSYKVIETEQSSLDYEVIVEEIKKAYAVITPKSDLFFVSRAMGKISIVFDNSIVESVDFGRELCLDQSEALLDFHLKKKTSVLTSIIKGGFLRKFENLKNFLKLANQHLNTFLPFEDSLQVANGKHSVENFQCLLNCVDKKQHTSNISNIAEIKIRPRVIMFSIMPDRGYSGGRYHALVLAEGLANCGYDVDIVTNNKPFFYDDFDVYDGHAHIRLHILPSYHDISSLSDDKVDAVFIVPDLSQKQLMYVKGVETAFKHNAPVIMINFESPNWFNSMVSGKREEALWDTWLATSKFSSVILSTTKESVSFAENFYIQKSSICKHKHLYAAINSIESESCLVIEEKEKRVIFFLPRARLSEHKGWKSITKMFGPSFFGHTLVLLCAQGSLDPSFKAELDAVAEKFNFNIEFKVRLNDRQKFVEISRACLMVFPSEFEGYGYPPVEALCVGTPCAVFDIPVLRETCQDYLIYSPVGDWDDLKYKVNEALENNFRLGSKAVERGREIASFYSFEDSIKSLMSELSEIPSLWEDEFKTEEIFYRSLNSIFYPSNKDAITDTLKKVSLDGTFKSIYQKYLSNETVAVNVDNVGRNLVTFSLNSFAQTNLNECKLTNFLNILKQLDEPFDLIVDAENLEQVLQLKKSMNFRLFPIGNVKSYMYRNDAAQFLKSIFSQYNYKSLTIVDDFLKYELGNCDMSQKLKYCYLDTDVGEINVSDLSGNSSKIISIPSTLPLTLQRCAWLTASTNAKAIAVYVDCKYDYEPTFIRAKESVIEVTKKYSGVEVKLFGPSASVMNKALLQSNTVVVLNNTFLGLINSLQKCRGFLIFLGVGYDKNPSDYFYNVSSLIGVTDISKIAQEENIDSFDKLYNDNAFFLKFRRVLFNERITQYSVNREYEIIKCLYSSTQSIDKRLGGLDLSVSSLIKGEIKLSPVSTSGEYILTKFSRSIAEGDILSSTISLKRLLHLYPNETCLSLLYVRLLTLAGNTTMAIYELESLIAKFPMEAKLYEIKADLAKNGSNSSLYIMTLVNAVCLSLNDLEFVKDVEFTLKNVNSKYYSLINNLLQDTV